jgi:hypothetical protein
VTLKDLLRLMLKEEFRTHTGYSGRHRFLMFPVFVFVLALGSGLTIDKMLETVSLSQFAIFAHISVFMYGLSVGAFGLMGREYLERRYGRSNYLVAMPYLLPISFKTTFLGIYLRDAIFYIALMLIPATLGLVVAAPFMGFAVTSILLFFVATLTTFMFGMSMSFLASVIYIRNVKAFLVFTAAIAIVFVLFGVVGVVDPELVMPSLGFQMNVRPFPTHAATALLFLGAGALATVVMTALAYALIEIRISIISQSYENLLPKYYSKMTWLSGANRALISKEFVDLKRSGTIAKMFFSFVLPLLFLSFTVWFVNYGLAIPVGFNAVFYAAMVGFVGVMMYSWLNNIDLSEYYSLLPVTVPKLIKVRVLVFLFLTLGISAFFVIAISVLNGETKLLWLALIVMFITSLYMVVMTAYLTGLKTNTFLFDTNILMKFTVLSFFPDLCLTILSFSLQSNWLITLLGISLVCGSLAISTVFFYRGIDRKWAAVPF